MQESLNKNFNHLKIHTQYSICEGAVKIEELKDFCKNNIIQSVGLSDTVNLCGALDFSVNISKSGSQPIIGTQIFFKFNDVLGLVPLIALNKNGYKRIIELSSKSYLENDNLSSPHCNFEDLLIEHEGISVFSGSVNGLIGKLFNKGRLNEIDEIYKKINSIYKDNFFIEIQRHGDQNEKSFENFNLNKSKELQIPIIATHEVFYLDKSMHDAHDALTCIGSKTYVNDKNRIHFKKIFLFLFRRNDIYHQDIFFNAKSVLLSSDNYNELREKTNSDSLLLKNHEKIAAIKKNSLFQC